MKRRRGITLIETLLYLALYALLMTGIFSAAYGLFESSDRDATSAMLEEEGDFLVGKIEWTLSGADSITQPIGDGDLLSVASGDGSTISVVLSGTDIRMQENGGASEMLNNSAVSVTGLSFIHNNGSSESVEASFTLHATTSTGAALSREFSTLHYLRQ